MSDRLADALFDAHQTRPTDDAGSQRDLSAYRLSDRTSLAIFPHLPKSHCSLAQYLEKIQFFSERSRSQLLAAFGLSPKEVGNVGIVGRSHTHGLMTPLIAIEWRSLGDSNPCFRRERATSWAARRRERWGLDSADCGPAQARGRVPRPLLVALLARLVAACPCAAPRGPSAHAPPRSTAAPNA